MTEEKLKTANDLLETIKKLEKQVVHINEMLEMDAISMTFQATNVYESFSAQAKKKLFDMIGGRAKMLLENELSHINEQLAYNKKQFSEL